MREKKRKFNLTDRLRSFRYAFNGVADLVKDEQNFRIHLVILIAVIVAGIIFRISLTEWLAILFVSALVLVSESFNTSLEHLSDAVSHVTDENIRKAKDTAAAAVLISAIAAAVTGLLIFIPELLELFA